MPHNGSPLQANMNFLGGTEDPFINRIKQAQEWSFVDNSGSPLPTAADVNGYPTSLSNGGLYTAFPLPTPSEISGRWKCRWTGDGTLSTFVSAQVGGGTVVPATGSFSGVNGFFTYYPDVGSSGGNSFIAITSINVASPITKIEFYLESQEALLDAGEVFTPAFKAKAAQFGRLRGLNWLPSNDSILSKWAHRKPLNYFSYRANENRSSLYKGYTTNTGDAYSINLGDGGTPADRDTWLVRWNATASGTSPTLNGKALHDLGMGPGDSLNITLRPAMGLVSCVVYEANLDCWFISGGQTASLDNTINGYSRGLANGAPPEIFARLCGEVGAHPWANFPALALDPITDYSTSFASYLKGLQDTVYPWMKPGYENINEVWNYSVGFGQTRYAWSKSYARWAAGGVSNDHDWMGRVNSIVGQAISGVYSNARSQYDFISGVQTFGDVTASEARMNGRHVSVDGGSPAANWITQKCCANYYSPSLYDSQTELQLAYDWSVGNSGVKAAALQTYVASCEIDSGTSLAAAFTRHQTWKAWHSTIPLTFYEGGYSPDHIGYDLSGTITAATKAASCVLTLAAGRVPAVGTSVTISGVVGMTQLNGNTYTVTAVSGQQVTVNVNSSAFGTYTSGGAALFVGSKTLLNTFRSATKDAPALVEVTRKSFSNCLRIGVYPSVYNIGGSDIWSVDDPSIYRSTPSPQTSVIAEVSVSGRPVRTYIRTS